MNARIVTLAACFDDDSHPGILRMDLVNVRGQCAELSLGSGSRHARLEPAKRFSHLMNRVCRGSRAISREGDTIERIEMGRYTSGLNATAMPGQSRIAKIQLDDAIFHLTSSKTLSLTWSKPRRLPARKRYRATKRTTK